MTNAATKKRNRTSIELLELLNQIRETRGRIVRANNYFNFAKEPELVEACVLEIKALEKRYEYLLRTYRQLDASQPPAVRSKRTAKAV